MTNFIQYKMANNLKWNKDAHYIANPITVSRHLIPAKAHLHYLEC